MDFARLWPRAFFLGAALMLCSEPASGLAPQNGTTVEAANAAADWSRYPRIGRNESKSGIWGDLEDQEWNYKYFDGWVYAGRGGERLVITSTSTGSGVEVYLYAAGATGSTGPVRTGRLLARGGQRLAVILPSNNEYLIVVQATSEDKSGTYTLATESSQVIEVAAGPSPRSSADIALSSRCEASNQHVQVSFSCPPGWVRTHWQDEYSFRQVNYRHPADWHVALNVRLYSTGIPVSLWAKSAEVYFSARDFIRKTRAGVYGLQGDSEGEELAASNVAWRIFAAAVTSRAAVSPPYGNLIPVDWMLEPRTIGSTTYLDVREGYEYWRENLEALGLDPIRGTRHAYGVTSLGGTLVVITLAGPPEVATDDLLRDVLASARISPIQ